VTHKGCPQRFKLAGMLCGSASIKVRSKCNSLQRKSKWGVAPLEYFILVRYGIGSGQMGEFGTWKFRLILLPGHCISRFSQRKFASDEIGDIWYSHSSQKFKSCLLSIVIWPAEPIFQNWRMPLLSKLDQFPRKLVPPKTKSRNMICEQPDFQRSQNHN